jgi:hypothetical protein
MRTTALEQRAVRSNDSDKRPNRRGRSDARAGADKCQRFSTNESFRFEAPHRPNRWPMTVPQPDSLRIYLGAVLVLLNRGAVSAGDTSRNANPNAAYDHSTARESSCGCVNGVSSSHGNSGVSCSFNAPCLRCEHHSDHSRARAVSAGGARNREASRLLQQRRTHSASSLARGRS